jgi:glycosyltransferase involved in cell wall biosynthesis
MPEVSVIVPVYNVENKIRRCLDSLREQSFTDFEVILVEDGSPDSSGKICDEYAAMDSRFRVIHQVNQGVSVARNNGIKAANGRYIGFVDSDDYVDQDYIKCLYETAEKTHSDIAMCNYYLVGADERLEFQSHEYEPDFNLNRNGIERVIYKHIARNDSTTGYFSLWNKLIKKELITRNHIFLDETMSFGEDMLFVMDCLKYCECISFTDRALYYYVRTENGLFSKYRPSFLNDIMKCYDSLVLQVLGAEPEKQDKVPLTLKYYGYILRHINGIIENEPKRNKMLKSVFRNQTVQEIFSVLLEQSNLVNLDVQDFRIIRAVNRKRYGLALFWMVYQYDDRFWLRKMRRKLSLAL